MKTIYKYPLSSKTIQFVELPHGSNILSAHMQHGQLWIWAMVDPELDTEKYEIRIYGTGHPIESPTHSMMQFIDTVHDGGFVWHVFGVLE